MSRSAWWRVAVGLVALVGGGRGAGASEPPIGPEQARSLRRAIEKDLTDELTRRWYPVSLDRARGGFHQNYARDWSPLPDANAFLVYQARMVWTAAAFAEFAPERKEEYLGYARHGLDFLDRGMRDSEQGGFHWILGADGKVDAKLGTEKHLYATTFVIYAGSKLREVGGDERALQVARDAFDWLETHAHDAQHGGYHEALARDGTPILTYDPAAPIAKRLDRMSQYYGFKSMNAHIHMLEAVAELARVDDRPVVKERLRELLHVVRDRIAVEPGALNLFLTPDWRAIPGHDSFGHDIETAYLLVEASEVLGDESEMEPTWRMARLLVDHALDWGWDAEYGGFYDKGESFNGAAFGLDKVWWTQAEGLNALLLLHRKYGGETDRYGKTFLQQWDFITKHLIDPEHGGWFEATTREGKLIGDGRKAQQWKANYHTGRALMNVARMLGEIEGGQEGR